MAKTYMILVALAAMVLGVYFKTQYRFIEDGIFPLLDEETTVLAYDDEVDGGQSKSHVKKGGSSLTFECTLGADTARSAWCGLILGLNKDTVGFRDWSFVDSVVFDVEAHGTEEVLVKLWTFDPDVTELEKLRSYRLLMKELPLKEGRQRISIPFEQFYTPDFWFQEGKVDTSLVDRHQERLARVEIAAGWNQPRGKKFSVKILEIKAKGLSYKAFGTMLFALLILAIIAIGRRHAVKENSVEK